MLDRKCPSAPWWALQRLWCSGAVVQCCRRAMLGVRCRARDGNDGAVLLAYCCFLGHVLVRRSSRGVAINTRWLGVPTCKCLLSFPATTPVINRQNGHCNPVCSLQFLIAGIACLDRCDLPSWATQQAALQALVICCSACQQPKSSQAFTAYRSCPCSADLAQSQRPPQRFIGARQITTVAAAAAP